MKTKSANHEPMSKRLVDDLWHAVDDYLEEGAAFALVVLPKGAKKCAIVSNIPTKQDTERFLTLAAMAHAEDRKSRGAS